MKKVKSCGVFCMREMPTRSFLLMKHPHRYDLPKGHIEEGESERGCALRELFEETGVQSTQIELDEEFCHRTTYYPKSKRYDHKEVEKELVVFLGWLKEDCTIVLSEHTDFEWIPMPTPGSVHERLDPLINAVREHLAQAS